MSIYIITMNEPNETTWETVKSEWPDRYHILTEHIAFVAPKDMTLTSDIANKLGMNGEDGILGIVVEMQNRAGYNTNSLSEWMEKMI